MLGSCRLKQSLAGDEPLWQWSPVQYKDCTATRKSVLNNNRSFAGREQLLAQQSWDLHEADMNVFTACRGWLHAAQVLPHQNPSGERGLHLT